MFKWIKGRQQSGYDKMLLATAKFPIPFDCYLLRFPEGSEIDTHTDPVDQGKRHFRLNIVLKHANVGGEFVADDSIVNWSRVKLFRPDITPHSVTRVERGTRYVLSVGWLRKEVA